MEPSNTPSSPPAKYVALGDALYDYVARHRSRVIDPLLAELRAETESLGAPPACSSASSRAIFSLC